jgi:hypothetical protein
VRRVHLLAAHLLAAIAAASALAAVAAAAGPGQYGPPEWLPLHSSSDGAPYDIGCVRTNCTISGAPYHDYWAIDFLDHANRPGAPVFAAGKGQVTDVVSAFSACGPTGTPANYVYISHGNGVSSFYVHLSTISVARGEWVDERTQIGTVGAVGYTFPCPAYHLHYAVYGLGSAVEPGPMKACHGNSLVTYPGVLGYSAWDALPPWQLGAWSSGVDCARTAPAAPTDVAAAADDGRATVRFTPPSTDGYSAITSYTVTASPGGARAVGAASPIVVEGLTNGTSYTFTITATNDVGTGAPSAPSNAVVPAGLPGTPADVSAVAGDKKVTVRFGSPASNGSPITGYRVTASPGQAHAEGAASPLVVRGLRNGTRYTFVVVATNAVGVSSPSTPSNRVVPAAKCLHGQRSTAAKPCRK